MKKGGNLVLPNKRPSQETHYHDKSYHSHIEYTAGKSTHRDQPRTFTFYVDAGVKMAALQKAGIGRDNIRLATNFTARRNFLPEHTLGRKPTYGALARPLPRKPKGVLLVATVPDETYTWVEDKREIRVEVWRNLILNKVIPSKNKQTFDVYASSCITRRVSNACLN